MKSYSHAEIAGKVIAASKFPKAAGLEDHTCHIYEQGSLVEGGSESPVMPKCGHVFGMTCLLGWAFNQFRHHIVPTCPYCRKPIVQGLADQLTAVEDQDDEELIDWMPGDSGIDFVHDYWTDEAEYRFTVLCDKMLEYPDSCEYFGGRSLSSEIRYFIYTLLPPIEKFLSYGNVHTFCLAYKGSGFTVEKPIEMQFPAPYVSLTRFLDRSSLDETLWRVCSAFQSSEPRFDEFRLRLQRAKARLRKRIEIARQARAFIIGGTGH